MSIFVQLEKNQTRKTKTKTKKIREKVGSSEAVKGRQAAAVSK
jgi:hypothetical protein